jgi:hypothetical protein
LGSDTFDKRGHFDELKIRYPVETVADLVMGRYLRLSGLFALLPLSRHGERRHGERAISRRRG